MAKFLIVDDNKDNLYLLEILLQGNGHNTVSAVNGAEALEMAIKNPPDIIVTDILMPVMDGFTLCQEWKKSNLLKKIPFVFYTATYTDYKDEEFALSLGADRFIIKPQESMKFLKIITETLETYKAGLIKPKVSDQKESPLFLKEYNETLIRKLEDKMIQTQKSEKEIRDYATKLELKIEELHQAKEIINESEENMKSLIENSRESIWSIDRDYHYIIINSYFKQMYKTAFRVEIEKGMNAIDILPVDLRSFWKPKYDTALSGKRLRFEYSEKINQEHRYFHVFLNPIYSGDHITGVSAISVDISEQKKLEEERNRLFNYSIDMLCIAGFDGYFKQVNPAWEKILGWSVSELMAKPYLDFVHQEDRESTVIAAQELREGKNVISYENRYQCKTGDYKWISWSSYPQVDTQLIFAVARDVTEKKKLEAQLLHSQKMEVIGTLSGGLAHDFNNLLTVINGYAEMILFQPDLEPDFKKSIENILDAGAQATGLTKQLLLFSRKTQPQFKPCDIHHILDGTRQILERTLGPAIEIQIHKKAILSSFIGDSSQIQQIIMNMAVNARDAMPQGGKLIFQTENVTLDEDYCKLNNISRRGDYLILSVKDTGTGMDIETQKHIYEPFYTTKGIGKGTGLGLSVVYGIVENHNGLIQVDSIPNQGTVFKIYFPVGKDMTALLQIEPNQEDIPFGHETILLVDDDLKVLEFGQSILTQLGYKIIPMQSGKETINIYQEKQSLIHLVITDLLMPDIDGRRLVEELKKINPAIKTILVSGADLQQSGVVQPLDFVDAFVVKPFKIAELGKTVRKILDEK